MNAVTLRQYIKPQASTLLKELHSSKLITSYRFYICVIYRSTKDESTCIKLTQAESLYSNSFYIGTKVLAQPQKQTYNDRMTLPTVKQIPYDYDRIDQNFI